MRDAISRHKKLNCLQQDYVGQILAALNAVHLSNLVHRGITPRWIGLASRENPSQPKMIKLCRVAFFTRLLDLHRSNSFGESTPLPVEVLQELSVPEGWLSKDVQNESSLLYTRQRDIHDVGIVLLKMLLGLDVVDRFLDPLTAIHSCKLLLVLFCLNLSTTLSVDFASPGATSSDYDSGD